MIQRDAEYRRISSLRRRALPPGQSLEGLREGQQRALGAALEALEAGPTYGCAIQLPVGAGKTLPSLLFANVFKAKRWLLVVMSHLRRKTQREADAYREQGFPVPTALPLCTYGDLSNKNWERHLTPDLDLIVMDEVQKVRNTSAGVTKRLRQYIADNPRCRVVVLSANLTSESIMDLWHVLDWTHRDLSPMPRSYPVAKSWQASLDPNVPEHMRESARMLLEWPGADVEGTDQNRARCAWTRRLADTPGIYIQTQRDVGVPLTVKEWTCTVPPVAQKALDALRQTWIRPDGHQLLLAPEYALAAGTLAYGYYHYWEEYPEQDWYDARSEYAAFVQSHLRYGRGMATEGDVRRAYPNAPQVTAWDAAQASFRPVSRVEFIDTGLLEAAAEWAAESDGRIVWCRHPDVVAKIGELSGGKVKAYGAGSKEGERLERGKGPAVASYRSHGTGRNLQRFWEALTLMGPVKAATLDQLIGRHWRAGQTEHVMYYVPLHTPEVIAPWQTTLESAEFLALNNQPQAIFNAYVEITTEDKEHD